MTWLLLVLTFPPSQVKKRFVGMRLSYKLSNMRLADINMACCFWLRLQTIKTSFKKGSIIIGNDIVGSGI